MQQIESNFLYNHCHKPTRVGAIDCKGLQWIGGNNFLGFRGSKTTERYMLLPNKFVSLWFGVLRFKDATNWKKSSLQPLLLAYQHWNM